MSRNFGSRVVRDIRDIFDPDETLHDSKPENEYVTGAEAHPTEGDPAHGIPAYPEPLPGGHEYRGKTITVPEKLAIPPAKPYYAGGMAHGVKSPVHYGGRVTPDHDERSQLETEPESVPEIGRFKIEPIPVYITEPGAGVHPLAMASFRQLTLVLGNDPVRIVERDPNRKTVLFLNETPTGGVRLLNGPDPTNGALLPAAMTNYREIETQDDIWAIVDSSASGNQTVSIIQEYKSAR